MVRTPVLTPELQDRSGLAETDVLGVQAHCPACGAELARDQEWCLECGAALAAVHAPPDWRIGLLIVLSVVAVVAIIAAVLWP